MALEEDNARIALGDELIANWNPANTADYDPTLAESDAKHLDVHLGSYDESKDFPQLALAAVAGQAMDQYIAGDGSGTTNWHRGRVDVHAYSGTSADLPENASKLAETIGWEVYRIIHAADHVTDSATGELLLTDVEPIAEPLGRVNRDADSPRYSALVQLGYRRRRTPP
jgi:hypothetical protein